MKVTCPLACYHLYIIMCLKSSKPDLGHLKNVAFSLGASSKNLKCVRIFPARFAVVGPNNHRTLYLARMQALLICSLNHSNFWSNGLCHRPMTHSFSLSLNRLEGWENTTQTLMPLQWLRLLFVTILTTGVQTISTRQSMKSVFITLLRFSIHKHHLCVTHLFISISSL